MSVILASSESAPSTLRAETSGGLEGLAALLSGGAKKKGKPGPAIESPFAAILAKAGETLRAAQAAKLAAKPGSETEISGRAGLGSRRAGDKAAGSEAAGDAATIAARLASARAGTAENAAARAAVPAGGAGSARGAGERAQGFGERRESKKVMLFASFDPDPSTAGGAARASGNPAKAPRSAIGDESRADGADPSRGREGGKPRTSLLDLRHSRSAQLKEAASQPSAADAQAPAREEPSSLRREVVRELGLEAPGSGKAEAGSYADKAEKGSAAGSDFSALLAQRLREAGNGEIVQAARIVLKDGDAGTIRLRLRPESLGEVKIELNLSDKSISGKIVVESEDAKSAFERNMAELSDAFRQGGFETAGLEVSVGSGSGRQAGGDGGSDVAPYFSERLRAVSAASEPVLAAGVYARGGNAVDLLV